MNIYAWHPDPTKSARGLANLHIGHMLLQATQMLGAALLKRGEVVPGSGSLKFSNIMINKLSEDPAFFEWTFLYAKALTEEHRRRFGTPHPSEEYLTCIRLRSEFSAPPVNIQEWPFRASSIFLSESGNPHDSYRNLLTSRYIQLARSTRVEWPLGYRDSPWSPDPLLGASFREAGIFDYTWVLSEDTIRSSHLPKSLHSHWVLSLRTGRDMERVTEIVNRDLPEGAHLIPNWGYGLRITRD